MANVEIQGVDGIKFDDAYVNGQKVNLALGKDTRPLRVRFALFFQTVVPMLLSITFMLAAFFIQTFTVPLLIVSLFTMLGWRRKRAKFITKRTSMFDKPKYATYTREMSLVDYAPKENIDELDEYDPELGSGVFFFGHEIYTEQEIHIADSKVRTHIIIFGTTGSGKTENILSICVNFLTQASGFILVDGKGDSLLFAKTFSLCRAYGRSDDLYLLNFMDKGSNTAKKIERITHKFNFFVDSTAEEADAIVGGLMPNDDGGGSGMWEGRAATTIESLNKSLYYLKDQGYLEIDPDTYRAYFSLDEFVALAMNENIPKPYRGGLASVLNSISYTLPSDAEPNPKQNSATEEQFQYITMQFTATFNLLAESYSHITVSQVPDISITDVVLRRRILLVLLPSLAKSDQQVRNLGRIIIAMTRNVSSKAIGNKVEGNIETTIESKPTAAVSSYGLIFDEFGAYATKGASTLPAQVRSLNMVCIFAGQDYEAFEKGDEIEAATIFANCTIKICMKLESPKTFEKFNDSAGQTYVMVQESYETQETMFNRKHVPAETARVEKRYILDLRDLKAQGPGQETLIYGDTTYRAQAFYADPKLTRKARLNHFLEIRRPKHPTIKAMREGVDSMYSNLRTRINGDWEALEDAIQSMITTFSAFNDVLMGIYGQVDDHIEQNPDIPEPTDTEMAIFSMSVFMKKVELVDYNIQKSLHETLGLSYDNEFDDADLLTDGDAEMEGFMDATSGQKEIVPQRLPEPEPVPAPAPETLPEDAWPEPAPAVADTPDVSAIPPEGKVVPVKVGEDPVLKVDENVFAEIEHTINEKRAQLDHAQQLSFNSLEEIQMSVFDTQRSIQQLEEVLLKKEGVNAREAERLSELTASNVVVEMGMKTNPAIISAKEGKRKSPVRSAQEVGKMVKRFVNESKVGA